MINESRPTVRARHVEIQHFAIQEWRNQGDIIMQHCPGVINSSDDLTKPLGWVLHSRHARRNMGHYRIGSPLGSVPSARPYMLEQKPSKPGRVSEPIRDQDNSPGLSDSRVDDISNVPSKKPLSEDPKGNSCRGSQS